MPRKKNAKKKKEQAKESEPEVVEAEVIDEPTDADKEEEEITFDFEKSDDTKEYDPLADDVKDDVVIENTGEGEIPEPDFTPPPEPPPGEAPPDMGGDPSAPSGSGGSPIEDTGFQEVTELPADQKRIAAEQLTTVMLGGYKKLHALGRWYAKMPEDKVNELTLEDKIDPNMNVPLNETGTKHATIAEFIADYNDQVEEGMQVSEEFIEVVEPAMVRVCIKHGWGLTDEWLLAYMFGEDLSTKAGMLYGYKKTMNMCLEAFQKAHAENKTEEKENVGDGLDKTE